MVIPKVFSVAHTECIGLKDFISSFKSFFVLFSLCLSIKKNTCKYRLQECHITKTQIELGLHENQTVPHNFYSSRTKKVEDYFCSNLKM